MSGRYVAFGDGKETGQPRLGCEKVVAIGIESGLEMRIRLKAIAVRAVEKTELHRHRHRAERALQDEQPGRARYGLLSRKLVVCAVRLDGG